MGKTQMPNFDNLIQETIREKISNNSPSPLPVSDAWQQLNQRLHERNVKSTIPLQRKFIYAASIVSVFVLLTVFLPHKSFAFTRLTEIFQKIEGVMVQLFTRSGDVQNNADAPTPDEFSIVEGSEIVTQKMNLDQAQKLTSFNISVPKVLPSEFSLKYVTVLKKGTERSREIFLNFEGNDRGFIINEKLVGGQLGSGTVVDREDTQVEQISLNGQEASLLSFKNGTTQLIWVTQTNYFSIEGKLTKQEIIQISKSM